MTKTIAIIQVKGGAGRSTVATNLAGELSKVGRTVLVDCDMPQGTSASWYAMREQAGLAEGLQIDTATTHKELVARAQAHQSADFIVLDGPPRIAEMTRASIVLADLCLIPVGASAAEIWASSDIRQLLTEAESIKKVKARLVWTRFRSNTNLAQTISRMATEELGIDALATPLGMRVAYMEALGEGRTAAETGDQSARAEVIGVTGEVLRLIGVNA